MKLINFKFKTFGIFNCANLKIIWLETFETAFRKLGNMKSYTFRISVLEKWKNCNLENLKTLSSWNW